jgi:hypothetical protein
MLAQEIDRLNAEAAQIQSRADQNARGGSVSAEKLEERSPQANSKCSCEALGKMGYPKWPMSRNPGGTISCRDAGSPVLLGLAKMTASFG